ncbi:hypothetical protein ASO20_02930 [Mycoplasma sp. (ex Biomphalaria glabrata)]|uniref:tRNA (adenine(22)-N(1))-methyltransferase TrmK n=1 Tax=Mycoplasma sp. (ex Biomphalaria glabrata) TaxID=1749074 RepID=UPI00073A8620|nr:tRNA (adenine(22)-N(1))-methyltransferase TrmK [Mycoplasma sp. (ex Biomphalaria glabrata)]ALV23588.1 hypothetical protein ASO20_02930 [Mycoplasma sp. (ex Biomphalaria glabrata)]
MALSYRLLSIANLIAKKKVVVDIGFDHAKLLIYLSEKKQMLKGYGIEKAHGPYLHGLQNAQNANLEKKIKLYFLNDVKNFKFLYKANYIVVSGLGCSTTIDILEKYKKYLLKKKIIIQLSEVTQTWKLREFMLNNKFKIVDEEFFQDGEEFYINIVCKKTLFNQKFNDFDLVIGPILKNENNVIYQTYLNKYLKLREEQHYDSSLKQRDLVIIREWIFQKF